MSVQKAGCLFRTHLGKKQQKLTSRRNVGSIFLCEGVFFVKTNHLGVNRKKCVQEAFFGVTKKMRQEKKIFLFLVEETMVFSMRMVCLFFFNLCFPSCTVLCWVVGSRSHVCGSGGTVQIPRKRTSKASGETMVDWRGTGFGALVGTQLRVRLVFSFLRQAIRV